MEVSELAGVEMASGYAGRTGLLCEEEILMSRGGDDCVFKGCGIIY